MALSARSLSFVNPSIVSWVDPEDNDLEDEVEVAAVPQDEMGPLQTTLPTQPTQPMPNQTSSNPSNPSNQTSSNQPSSKYMMMSLIKSLFDDIRRNGLRPGPIGKVFSADHEWNGVPYIQFFQGVRDKRTGELRPERLWGRKTVIDQLNDQLRHYSDKIKAELIYDAEKKMYCTFLI
jgi:hypothetical protein